MTSSTDTTLTILQPARAAVWRYVGGLAPVVLLWAALAGWLAWQLADRADWSDQADQALMREWIEETRIFRQSLPELIDEYAHLNIDDSRRVLKRAEIQEQLKAMVEPMRTFTVQLPAFPEIFSLAIEFRHPPERIAWDSPVPRPPSGQSQSIRLYPVSGDGGVVIVCNYKLHAYNRLQQQEENRRQTWIVAGVLLATATILAGLFVWRFLAREHAREIDRLTAVAESRHRERDLLAARLASEETELAAQDLKRRAVEAEKEALEIKSQIYASIGIMAGSYAHNIKNLLVRPNDLLARCLEVDGLSPQQEGMLSEVKGTLGTVTERLQQILRTVRRDPQQPQRQSLNLNAVVKDTVHTWRDTASEKWKLHLAGETEPGNAAIVADASHLQQAIENLLFNSRDATFEMRNHIRDQAREETDTNLRKEKLLAAAAWKGEITLVVKPSSAGPILEVRDNGIGMSDDVKANCLKAHFTTKRDNALYEGYTAGMGLGLSFVAMVLQQHGATLEIDSAPLQGTRFRILFANA